MFRFSKRHYGFVVLILVLIFKGIKLDDFCTDVLDTFILGGLGLLFFMVFLVVTFYNLYYISLKKEFFDFFTPVFMIIFGILFYIRLTSPSFDILKTKTQVYESKSESNLELILYTDKTFMVQSSAAETTCFQKGKYTIDNNQLLLSDFSFDDKKISKKYVMDSANGILIARDTLKIKSLH